MPTTGLVHQHLPSALASAPTPPALLQSRYLARKQTCTPCWACCHHHADNVPVCWDSQLLLTMQDAHLFISFSVRLTVCFIVHVCVLSFFSCLLTMCLCIPRRCSSLGGEGCSLQPGRSACGLLHGGGWGERCARGCAEPGSLRARSSSLRHLLPAPHVPPRPPPNGGLRLPCCADKPFML